jgi:putative tryptophan/tyrosine transport system substrate-binding protein
MTDVTRWSSGVNKRSALGALLLALCAMLLAPCFSVQAQQVKKVPRIGYLSATSPSSVSGRTEAFRQALRELGYVEGKNIAIEYRFANGKLDLVPQNAAELVRLKVDVIVTNGPTDTRAANEATVTIPIVMAQDSDPVGSGFVASLARPGGNITGLSTLSPELSGKQLELLKEIVPKLSRVAILGNSTEPGNAPTLKEMQLAADALGVQLHYLDIRSAKDIETAFSAIKNNAAGAFIVLRNAVTSPHRKRIVDFAAKSHLPGMYVSPEWVEAGGLMSYGVSFTDLFRRAARYVDKIVKGAKPADLPVEQPTKFEFVINLKTAKQIGLTIPPDVLARADRVIR